MSEHRRQACPCNRCDGKVVSRQTYRRHCPTRPAVPINFTPAFVNFLEAQEDHGGSQSKRNTSQLTEGLEENLLKRRRIDSDVETANSSRAADNVGGSYRLRQDPRLETHSQPDESRAHDGRMPSMLSVSRDPDAADPSRCRQKMDGSRRDASEMVPSYSTIRGSYLRTHAVSDSLFSVFPRDCSPFSREEDCRHRPYCLESRRNINDGSFSSSDYIGCLSEEELRRCGNSAYLSLLGRYTSLRSDYEHQKRAFNHTQQQLSSSEAQQAQLRESYEKLLSTVQSRLEGPERSSAPFPVNPALRLSSKAQHADETALRRKDHKHISFWTKLEWNKFTTGGGSVANPQDVVPDGPKKASNKKLHFIQRSDGTTVTEEDAEKMRGLSKSIWFSFLSYCSTLPLTWLQAPLDLREHFNREMTAHFPDLRLCDSNWKVTEFASIYYAMWRPRFGALEIDKDTVSRKRSKPTTPFLGSKTKRVRLEIPATKFISPDSVHDDEPNDNAASLDRGHPRVDKRKHRDMQSQLQDPLDDLFNDTGASSSRPSASYSNTSGAFPDNSSNASAFLDLLSSPDHSVDSSAPASSSSAAALCSPATLSSLSLASPIPGNPGPSSTSAATITSSNVVPPPICSVVSLEGSSRKTSSAMTTDPMKPTPGTGTQDDQAVSASKGVTTQDDTNTTAKLKGKAFMKPLVNFQTPESSAQSKERRWHSRR